MESSRSTLLPGNAGLGLKFCGLLAACGLFCMLFVDFPVGHWFHDHKTRGELGRFLDSAEHFATPFGQLLVVGTLFVALPVRDFRLGRLFVAACAGGLLADVVKLTIARTRPRAFDFEVQTLADGFTRLFPFGAGGSGVQSFPSAHTASAMAFACLLAWRFPKGRPAFLMLAALAGLQRICSAAHFPSDVFLGAALGWGSGLLWVRWTPLVSLCERVEERLATRGNASGAHGTGRSADEDKSRRAA